MAISPESMASAPQEPLVDGAPRVWTDYPEPGPVFHQVIPYGMWPWESQKAKAARHGAAFEGADKIIAAALGEQLASTHPETAHLSGAPVQRRPTAPPAPPTQH
jgi:hypothetical protein